jgi:hypothetical protein
VTVLPALHVQTCLEEAPLRPPPNRPCNATIRHQIPLTTGIGAVAGSTNVTVDLLSGSQLTVNNNGALLMDASQATNQGAITISGDELGGTITTSGMSSLGPYTQNPNNTLINDTTGQIMITGSNSTGMLIDGSSVTSITTTTMINCGLIVTTAPMTSDTLASGSNNTLINTGTMITSGDFSSAMVAYGNNNAVTNTGNIAVSGSSAAAILAQGDEMGPWPNQRFAVMQPR